VVITEDRVPTTVDILATRSVRHRSQHPRRRWCDLSEAWSHGIRSIRCRRRKRAIPHAHLAVLWQTAFGCTKRPSAIPAADSANCHYTANQPLCSPSVTPSVLDCSIQLPADDAQYARKAHFRRHSHHWLSAA
jgi:hypothetical protein